MKQNQAGKETFDQNWNRTRRGVNLFKTTFCINARAKLGSCHNPITGLFPLLFFLNSKLSLSHFPHSDHIRLVACLFLFQETMILVAEASIQVLFLHLAISSAEDHPDCGDPEGFRPDNFSLLLLGNQMLKPAARDFCAGHGMTLASLEEEEQFNATRRVIELCRL